MTRGGNLTNRLLPGTLSIHCETTIYRWMFRVPGLYSKWRLRFEAGGLYMCRPIIFAIYSSIFCGWSLTIQGLPWICEYKPGWGLWPYTMKRIRVDDFGIWQTRQSFPLESPHRKNPKTHRNFEGPFRFIQVLFETLTHWSVQLGVDFMWGNVLIRCLETRYNC